MNYSSYGGGGYGQCPSNFSGDVGPYAAQLHGAGHPTPLQALVSAVALPDVFTDAEMLRTLRRNNGDVMRAALQLKEKHAYRRERHYLALNVGLPTLQEELRKGYAHLLDGASDHEGCPVLLLQLQHFRPGDHKLQRQGQGTADGSAVSSLEDARRLCVYLMDVAVEVMEEQQAPGIVFIVDVAHCTLANLEAKMVTDILQMCKNCYPEVVKRIVVINSSAFAKVLTAVLVKLLGIRTQQRLRVITDPRELSTVLPATAIPQHYGGTFKLLHPTAWMKKQAELEDVDLNAAVQEEEEDDKGFGLEEQEIDPNESLNGMQYADVSAVDAAEMPQSVLRGPLMRKKMDGVWAKHFALLRPQAMLLYENATGVRPIIIIPVNYEVRVAAATFPDRPKGCGFRVEVPGVVGGHELVATSEQERGNWLQELQWAINKNKEKLERREDREERRAKLHREFDALNMINFDVELPVPEASKAATQVGEMRPQLQQVRPPQPVDMARMSIPTPMLMSNMTAMMKQPMMPTQQLMQQPQLWPMGIQSQQSRPMSGISSTTFGTQQQQGTQSMAIHQSMGFGIQQHQVTSVGMQQQRPMAMNMQSSMSMGMQQPMMMGVQQQQPIQMQRQQQTPMNGHHELNMPVTSTFQLNSKSLQEQLLGNFRG